MRKIGLILIKISVALLILLPLIFVVLSTASMMMADTQSSTLFNIIKDFDLLVGVFRWLADMELGFFGLFRGLFFTVLPALAIIGFILFFNEKLTSVKKEGLGLADGVWLVVLLVSLGLFIIVYIAKPGSLFYG
ncbi:MAG: hypothetical protein H3C43_12745, partial [Leptonema sp. (in: Bacteria)]|nr:hypothetical protein [Leptonema sp. (in: bacteria)]